MVGILALQGAFAEHASCIEKLGGEYILIRKKEDLNKNFDRIILPGGESTTQRKLMRELDIFDDLKAKIENGMPVLATCAGLILLAEKIENEENICFGTLPVKVVRNAYGRQLGSFSVDGNIGTIENYPMRFIRAPFIKDILSDEVEILNKTDEKITAVKYKNQIGLSFHPELTSDLRIHEMFLNL